MSETEPTAFNPCCYACFAARSSFVLTEYNKWKVGDAAYMLFAATAQNTINSTRLPENELLLCFIFQRMFFSAADSTFQ